MPLSSKDKALSDLRLRILSTDIAPGADLDEARLSDTYGISRTPLREVLQKLAGEGFVMLAPNRGAKVASMDLSTMRSFFQTAPMIYASIARLAAGARNEEQMRDLKEVQAQFRQALLEQDSGAAALANHRFHALIGEMAHNVYLSAALQRLLIDHTRMSQTFYAPASDDDRALVETAADQHDAMIAAIEAQDAETVVQLTLDHWDLSRNRMERFVRPDPLPMENAHAV
ncbi:MAG: GntR family transcriptional regulator [Pseudomonadota bacterium]